MSADRQPDVQQALLAIRATENAINLGDQETIVLSHSLDCQLRHRAEFVWGREQIRVFLARTWRRQIHRRVVGELWAAQGDRIATRFAAEFRDDNGTWFRAYGSETWEYDAAGLIRRRFTTMNEHAIAEHERLLRWPAGVRPDEHPTLSELGI